MGKGFKSCHISSRYETEDQSEYRTDEDEAGAGHPQTTDIDEGETEIGRRNSKTIFKCYFVCFRGIRGV